MPYALKAQRLIGLSATLGGKVGLQRYQDYFKKHAQYDWFIPENEERLDLARLKYEKWTTGTKKTSAPPYESFVQLIQEKQLDPGIPTLILAESDK